MNRRDCFIWPWLRAVSSDMMPRAGTLILASGKSLMSQPSLLTMDSGQMFALHPGSSWGRQSGSMFVQCSHTPEGTTICLQLPQGG